MNHHRTEEINTRKKIRDLDRRKHLRETWIILEEVNMSPKQLRKKEKNTSGEAKKHIKKGKRYLRELQYDEAIEEFDKATSLESENAWIWIDKGDAHLGKREYEEAIDCYEKAMMLDLSAEWMYWYKKGFAYKEEKRMEKAKDCFEKTLNSLLSDSNFKYDMKNHLFLEK